MYLVPPQSLSRKQIKTELMLCEPLFIVRGRLKGFLKVIATTVQKRSSEHLHCKSGHGTCIARLYVAKNAKLQVSVQILLHNKKQTK